MNYSYISPASFLPFPCMPLLKNRNWCVHFCKHGGCKNWAYLVYVHQILWITIKFWAAYYFTWILRALRITLALFAETSTSTLDATPQANLQWEKMLSSPDRWTDIMLTLYPNAQAFKFWIMALRLYPILTTDGKNICHCDHCLIKLKYFMWLF